MIERLQVRVPGGAVGEFSSPGSTFCADCIWYPFHPCVTAAVLKLPCIPRVWGRGWGAREIHATEGWVGKKKDSSCCGKY